HPHSRQAAAAADKKRLANFVIFKTSCSFLTAGGAGAPLSSIKQYNATPPGVKRQFSVLRFLLSFGKPAFFQYSTNGAVCGRFAVNRGFFAVKTGFTARSRRCPRRPSARTSPAARN